MTEKVPCPLCGSFSVAPSWFAAASFAERPFPYAHCTTCGSHFSHPMPDDATLAAMYGGEYAARPGAPPTDDADEHAAWVVAELRRQRAGTFLDYGCGAGGLLVAARDLGWEPIGVELDADVARVVARATGARTCAVDELRNETAIADVLHLGDVVEHLTQPLAQLREILRLVRPGGLLLAQGPLEGNASVFFGLLRLKQWLRPRAVGAVPPYHVLLATADGQRALFERAGLREESFTMREVDWPVPSTISGRDLFVPGRVGLFAARRLSRAVSALAPTRFGNRYSYRGRFVGL